MPLRSLPHLKGREYLPVDRSLDFFPAVDARAKLAPDRALEMAESTQALQQTEPRGLQADPTHELAGAHNVGWRGG